MVLLGPNGCGKSTLLACLAGLVPEYVNAWCQDRNGNTFKGWCDRTALVPQNPYSAFFAPSVEREIAFPLENLGLERRQIIERVEEALDWAGIRHLRERNAATLSGGEAQRVHLAVTRARRPGLYLLDEPLAYLDAEAAADFVQKLNDIEEPALVVDHDPAPWRNWANEWWYISPAGQLQVLESPPVSPEAKILPDGEPGSEHALVLEGLWFRYREGPWIFRDFSLEVKHGETLAVVGPSGSGKTTLFRLLTGQERPQRGSLWAKSVQGPSRWQALALRSAVLVPQNPEHYFWKPSVREEARTDGVDLEVLARFGLEGHGERSPFTLSSGEQRRLTLACALGKDRDIVLLDEPSFGLDEASFLMLMEDLKKLQREGKTVLMITHREDLARMAHRRVRLQASVYAS